VDDAKSELLTDKIKSGYLFIDYLRADYISNMGLRTRDIRKAMRHENAELVSGMAHQLTGSRMSTFSMIEVHLFEDGFWTHTGGSPGKEGTATIIVRGHIKVVRQLEVVDEDYSSSEASI